jgi:hypothetical protein
LTPTPDENHPYRADPRFLSFEHGAPKPSDGLGAGGRRRHHRLGEAFGYEAGPVTIAALTRIVAPFAVGRDAIDIPALMRELWFRTKDKEKTFREF